MEFTFIFLKVLYWSLYLLTPILAFLLSIIILAGYIVGRLEGWYKFDSIYWAFVTATTVGYGDIRPSRKPSRVISILIAITGMIFTGVIIAAALNSVNISFDANIDPSVLESIKEKFNQ